VDDNLLQQQLRDAVVVKEMMATAGWKVLEKYIDEIYAAKVANLIEAEDAEARTVIRGITSYRRAIAYILEHGKRANQELSKKGE